VFSDVSAGGIVNTGMIAAGSAGIGLFAISTFTGGISNSGSISAANRGIQLGFSTSTSWAVSSFTGDIANAGTIVAATGIALFDSTVAGAIVDSGSIKAASRGILIDSASEILATKTAVAIAGEIFTGGITNFGVISGSAGIAIKSARPVSIFDAGAIIGTGGTAIQFAGSGNTLTLGAGYTIGGAVDPAGGNVLQLGGTGSDTFDLSSIGPQYKGFTTFNVIGGTWTVSGAGSGTSGWHIDGGTMELAGGAPLTATTVSSGGVLVLESGAVANVTQVKGGGTAVIEPGGSAFATTVSSGGAIEFISGSTASANLNPGAIVEFGPGEVLSNINVSGGAIFEVLAGGRSRRHDRLARHADRGARRV
jgi:autotransporter passenger strand-loop-strand repeat protein